MANNISDDTICELCKINPKIVIKNCKNGLRIRKNCYKCHYKNYGKQYAVNNLDKQKIKHKNYWTKFKNDKELGLKDNLANVLGQINAKSKRYGGKQTIKIAEFREFLKQQTCCQDCGSNEKLNVGHMIPLFYPIGKQEILNLIRQCFKCNRKQGTKIHIKVATEELKKWYPIYVPVNYSNNGE